MLESVDGTDDESFSDEEIPPPEHYRNAGASLNVNLLRPDRYSERWGIGSIG
jgi:hypothetical protein